MHYRFAFITGIIYVIYRRIRDIAYLVISTQLFGLIRATVFAPDNRSIIASSLYSVSRPKIGIIQMKLYNNVYNNNDNSNFNFHELRIFFEKKNITHFSTIYITCYFFSFFILLRICIHIYTCIQLYTVGNCPFSFIV